MWIIMSVGERAGPCADTSEADYGWAPSADLSEGEPAGDRNRLPGGHGLKQKKQTTANKPIRLNSNQRSSKQPPNWTSNKLHPSVLCR